MRGCTLGRLLAKHPIASLVLFVLLINAPSLTGLFDNDPDLQYSFLGIYMREGWAAGPQSWIDPSPGYITQPLGFLAASDWLHGIIPWWNPYAGVGMPLAAEMQTSSFFLPFVLLLHFNAGWLYLRAILEALSAIFTYRLLIGLALSRGAAMFGGMLYALSPMFFLCPSAAITQLPFLPLLLLGIEHSFAAAVACRGRGWSLVVVALAYSLYGGFPEVMFMNGLLAGVWTVWRLRGLELRMQVRFLAKLATAGVIALGLAAPLLVPFLEYLANAFVAAHERFFRHAVLAGPLVPLQVFPFLYGWLSSPPPAALAKAYGEYTRLPGWVDVSALLLAAAALWRHGPHRGLRFALCAWIVVMEARVLGVPPVVAAFDVIPPLAAADCIRYGGPAMCFAVYLLAAFAIDDLRTQGGLTARQWGAVMASVAAILILAVVPQWHFARAWFAAQPQDGRLALAAAGCDLVVAALVARALRRAAPTWRLSLVCLVVPLTITIVPQFAGVRTGHIDPAPIAFLRAHLGDERMMSDFPLPTNLPDRYGLATLTYSALPVPRSWALFLHHELFARADRINYNGNAPGQAAALAANIGTYETTGLRYIITLPHQSPLPPPDAGVMLPPDAAALRLVFSDGHADIYELPHPAPYVSVLGGHCALTLASRQTMTADCSAPDRLLRRELFFPGWQVRLNGAPAPLTPVAIFQSVALSAGRSDIVFTYRPPYTRLSCAAALLAMVLWVALGAGHVRGASRR
jgi:hypothetical protein